MPAIIANYSYNLHLPMNSGAYLDIPILQFLYFVVIHCDLYQMRLCKTPYILLSDHVFKCITFMNLYVFIHSQSICL